MSRIWTTRKGKEIPAKYVPSLDKKKTLFNEKQVAKALKLQKQMIAFKDQFLAGADEIFELMQADANVRTGDKGNYTISSFDGMSKIEVSVPRIIEFDETIQFAKQKFDEFKAAKTKDTEDPELLIILDHAFTTSGGRLDTKKVLELFSYKISHPLWLDAIELLKKSIKTRYAKRYARIYLADKEGQLKPIDMNLSSL